MRSIGDGGGNVLPIEMYFPDVGETLTLVKSYTKPGYKKVRMHEFVKWTKETCECCNQYLPTPKLIKKVVQVTLK